MLNNTIKINIIVITLLLSFSAFSQKDNVVEKPVSHFPSGYDKDPGFYEVAAEEIEGDIGVNEDGTFGEDDNVSDYFGEFGIDKDENHRKSDMYKETGDVVSGDPMADTDLVAVREGKHTWFAEDSDIVIARGNYDNGWLSGHYRKWTDDGKTLITDMAYKKGAAQGKATLYYNTGQVKSKAHYNKGNLNGEYIKYRPNGAIENQGFFVAGKPDGEQISYHENGQIKTVTTYKKGVREGAFISYDETGKVLENVNYAKGIKAGSTSGIQFKKKGKGRIFKIRMDREKNKQIIERIK